MSFRFIPTQAHTAAMNMALDEACMEQVRAGNVSSTIRLYRWKPSAVSIGNFQCLMDEIDINQVKQAGIDVVRRETGGGAVYHDAEGEVTYSIIGSEKDFPLGIKESYELICGIIVKALQSLGIAAEFRAINDIIVDGKKISGNAQTRKGGVFLQHGTILLSVDAETMFRYLTPDKAKISDKPYIKSVKSAVTSVYDLVDVTREEVESALKIAFFQQFPSGDGAWTPEEKTRAEQLVLEKYAQESWNAMR